MNKVSNIVQSELTASLIAAAKGGSNYAFTRLVRLHQSSVRAFLRRLAGGDAALADDMAQEVFMKAYLKIRSFSGEGTFGGWLYRIAYRYFLDDYRKKKRRQNLSDIGGTTANIIQISPVFDLKLDLERALAGLKLEERTAITLCLSEGLSHTEAADIMDMPLGSVKSHIVRGREKLKITLKIWQGEQTSYDQYP